MDLAPSGDLLSRVTAARKAGEFLPEERAGRAVGFFKGFIMVLKFYVGFTWFSSVL